MTIDEMRDDELARLFTALKLYEAGSKEYEAIRSQISALLNDRNNTLKLEHETKKSKTENKIKIGCFVGTLILTPIIDLCVKSILIRKIGTIEQMETFTSTPGRSIANWFK